MHQNKPLQFLDSHFKLRKVRTSKRKESFQIFQLRFQFNCDIEKSILFTF